VASKLFLNSTLAIRRRGRRRWLGAGIATTQRYIDVNDEMKRAAVELAF
jgi:hypothetical protein